MSSSRHKEWLRWIPSINEYVLYRVGKNANGNDVILTEAEPQDVWFHVQDVPSCHVIARVPTVHHLTKKQLHAILVQGAVLCKKHSKRKSDKEVPVVWAWVADVQKTNVPGRVVVSGQETHTVVV